MLMAYGSTMLEELSCTGEADPGYIYTQHTRNKPIKMPCSILLKAS
jgi:hypothetical protein